MKKFFYLMSVACLLMAASCEKDGNGKDETPEAPVVTIPEGVKTAGSELILLSEGFDNAAKMYLQAGEDKIALDDVKISASGATVKLPYNLGKYTLVVEQEGVSFELGKITIAVTDVVLPETAVFVGTEITLAGNGFAQDAIIFIGGKEAATTVETAGVKVVVPADVDAENSVSVKQAGTEQEFEGKLKVMAKKNRTGIMVMPFFGMTAKYDNNGEPVEFVWSDFMMEYETSYHITKSGNVYSFVGEMLSWSFKVENGRVASINYDGKDYDWTYNEDGQLESFYVDDVEPYVIAYEDGNCVNFGSLYENPAMTVTNPYEIDFGVALGEYMELSAYGNTEIFYTAMMFGWVGNPSKCYPSSNADMGDPVPFEYTYADGYVTSAAAGDFNVICEF